MTRFLSRVKDFLSRWEKLFTVPASAAALLMALTAVCLSFYTLIHSQLLARAVICTYPGTIHLKETTYRDQDVSEEISLAGGDSVLIGGQLFRIQVASPMVRHVLEEYDSNPHIAGAQVEMSSDFVRAVIYAMVVQDSGFCRAFVDTVEGAAWTKPSQAFIAALEERGTDAYLGYAAKAFIFPRDSWVMKHGAGGFQLVVANLGDRAAIVKGIECRVGLYNMSEMGTEEGQEQPVQLLDSEFYPLYLYDIPPRRNEPPSDPLPIVLEAHQHERYTAVLSPFLAESLLTCIGGHLVAFHDTMLYGFMELSCRYDEADHVKIRSSVVYVVPVPGYEASDSIPTDQYEVEWRALRAVDLIPQEE